MEADLCYELSTCGTKAMRKYAKDKGFNVETFRPRHAKQRQIHDERAKI